jgi:thiamine-monophosphate kinase
MKKHLMPEPVPLKSTAGITSMLDISDGLLIDLNHICEESNAGAIIYSDKIPLSGDLALTAKKSGSDPLQFALKGGEDYALLFTTPSKYKKGAYRIGEIIKKGRFIVDKNGKKTAFKAEGYEHFKR